MPSLQPEPHDAKLLMPLGALAFEQGGWESWFVALVALGPYLLLDFHPKGSLIL